MTNRIDVMVDIETLGTNSDSTVIQIAAMAFDIITGETKDTFEVIADISKNEFPISVTGRTIQWWLNTNSGLFKKLIMNGSVSSEEMVFQFHQWLKVLQVRYGEKNVYLWGNGILFDNKMIAHQMELVGLNYPVFYRNDRDVRTIVDLAGAKSGLSEKELKAKFNDDSLVAHNAFDDVIYQISLVSGCYNMLIK